MHVEMKFDTVRRGTLQPHFRVRHEAIVCWAASDRDQRLVSMPGHIGTLKSAYLPCSSGRHHSNLFTSLRSLSDVRF